MTYISCSRCYKGKVQGIPGRDYIHSYRQFRITFRAQTQAVSNPLAISGG